MMMSDGELAYGYIEDFFTKHVNSGALLPDQDLKDS
jgi:hypothetical protein